MAISNIVYLSELSGTTGIRIDAEYYDPESMRLERRLRRTFNRPLSGFGVSIDASAFYPSIAEYYQDSGIPFVRVRDIMDGLIKNDEMIFLPAHVVDEFSTIRQGAPGDLVITKGGTVGVVAMLPDEFSRYALSRDLIVIRTATLSIKQAISIMLFLMCKYGEFQLLRGKSQQVQPHLTIPLIRNLIIPDLEVEEAIDNYVRSARHFKESKLLYSQAKNLLLEELGLRDFQPKYELSYTANLSQAFQAHRVDAEHFQPAYDQVTEKVISYKNGYTTLLNCAESVRPDFDPPRHPDSSFHYVELADIDTAIGIIRSASEVRGEEAPSRARRVLGKGDVIVSSVEGSLEKVALVDEEYEGFLASTGFFQFRARTIYPEVLLALSKSIVLQTQFKRECAGTILTAVPNESLKRIVVPILPPETQQEITLLVQQSHEARRKAKALLEKAKRAVEIAIEEGEERAIEFLK